jgi:membrane protein DedA with SNARE-associated domain
LEGIVSAYIEHFTYLGLFVVLVLCSLGLPFPEDLALLAGGFLAHRGVTNYPFTVAVSFVGVVAGDNSLFFLGRRFGSGLMRYVGVFRTAEGRMAKLHQFMNRHGNVTIFYARFFSGLRALVYLSAGSIGFRPSRFFLYDLLGAAVSVPIVVSLGYFFGPQLEVPIHYLGGAERAVAFIVALSFGVYALRLAFTSGGSRSDLING